MEVAIKMAMRLWDIRVQNGTAKSIKIAGDAGNGPSASDDDLNEERMKKVIVLTQKDCYHGKYLNHCTIFCW